MIPTAGEGIVVLGADNAAANVNRSNFLDQLRPILPCCGRIERKAKCNVSGPLSGYGSVLEVAALENPSMEQAR
jgi:hypothetical protein